MKKVVKKTISIILNILLLIITLILAILIYSYAQTKLFHKEYSNIFGYSVFKVVTGSMADTINVGDVVFVKIKKEKTDFYKNDIIVFKQENSIITHRIVEIDGQNIITKGDANNTEDEPITREEVIGKVIKTIPNIDIWKKVFSSPQVLISIITTIILFTIAFSYDGSKESKTNHEQNSSEEKEDKQ